MSRAHNSTDAFLLSCLDDMQ